MRLLDRFKYIKPGSEAHNTVYILIDTVNFPYGKHSRIQAMQKERPDKDIVSLIKNVNAEIPRDTWSTFFCR